MKRIVSFLLQTDQVFYSISLEETKGTRLNQLGKNSRTLACLFQNSKMVRPNDVYDQEPYHASLLDTAQVSGQVKEMESLMKIHDREVGIFESSEKLRSLDEFAEFLRLIHGNTFMRMIYPFPDVRLRQRTVPREPQNRFYKSIATGCHFLKTRLRG